MGTILLVVSGKGGTGKSTVAAGLARNLAQLQNKVLLVDTDAGIASAEMLAAGGEQAVYTLADVLDDAVSFSQALVQTKGQPDFLAAPKLPFTERQTARLPSFLEQIATEYNTVVVDRPSGLDFSLEQALSQAIGLIVASPDPLAVRSASLIGQGLQQAGHTQQYLILNQFLPKMIRFGVLPDIDSLCDTVGVQLLGIIPMDGQVLLDAAKGRFSSSAAYGKALKRIALRLNGQSVPLPKLNKLQN